MSLSRKNNYNIPVSFREWIVCVFATLTLVFTAWSLGGYNNWALHLLFLGGLATFLASVFPMPRSWNGYDQQHGNLKNYKRLLAQPFFWVSLCFLIYILIQYFNPSAVQVFGEKSWWVEPMIPPLGANLPTSVKADYNIMNALRTFVIQTSAIGLSLGILVGIQRRKSALIILWSFVISGVTMGFVAILQKLSGTDKILWIVDTVNSNPWGTFAYRNQGAAFLILVLLISGLLYFLYKKRATAKLEQGGPHLLLFLFIVLMSGSLWLCLSRSGIILGGILVGVFLILVFLHNLFVIIKGGSWVNLVLSLGIFAVCSFYILQFSDWDEVDHRVEDFKEIVLNLESYERFLSTKATFEMAQDRLNFGWGAGSFRYIFPIYQREYEQLWHFYDHRNKPYGRKIYNYAHNDLIQFLAEYGVVGCLLIVLMFSCLLTSLIITVKKSFSISCFLYLGIFLILANNFIDYIFSSPAYWVAFWGSLFLSYQLLRLDHKSNFTS